MNRISSLRRPRTADTLHSAAKSTLDMTSRLDRITGYDSRYTDYDLGLSTGDGGNNYGNYGDAEAAAANGDAAMVREQSGISRGRSGISAALSSPSKSAKSSTPTKSDPCNSTIDSGNHSSIFSNESAVKSPPNNDLNNTYTSHSNVNGHPDNVNNNEQQEDLSIRGSYNANKTTLGLELVASPSLLEQVLDANVMDLNPRGSDESTLSSKSSFRRDIGLVRCARDGEGEGEGNVQEEEEEEQAVDKEEEEQQDEDDIFDDESEYSAMPTVAMTVLSVKSKKSVADDSSMHQDDVLLARNRSEVSQNSFRNRSGSVQQCNSPQSISLARNRSELSIGRIRSELSAKSVVSSKSQTSSLGPNSLVDTSSQAEEEASVSKPLPLKSSYSMRSIKSSEGMEVGQFFNTILPGKVRNNSLPQQPFDKTDAKMIASTKAAAIATNAAAAAQTKPPSCLRPSSFATPNNNTPSSSPTAKNLPSPNLVQNGRVNRSAVPSFAPNNNNTSSSPTAKNLPSPNLVQNGRVNRSVVARFRSSLKGGKGASPLPSSMSPDATAAASPSATTNAATASPADDATEEHSITITQVSQKSGQDESSHPCFSAPVVSFAEKLESRHVIDESGGQYSPTSVYDFMNDEQLGHQGQGEENTDNASHDSSNGKEHNSSITNRLARNRQALKSIALAKGASKKKSHEELLKREKEGIVMEADQEGIVVVPPKDANNVVIVSKDQSEGVVVSPKEQQEGDVPLIVQSVSDLDIPQFSPEGTEGVSTDVTGDVIEGKGQGNESTQEEDNGPSIEIDASALLNTSTASREAMIQKKKRFILPRLRRRAVKSPVCATNKSPTRTKKSPTMKMPSVNKSLDKSPATADKQSPKNSSSNKRSLKSKLFRGKSKKEDAKMKKVQEERSAMKLEAIKEVEKYTAWLAAPTEAADEYPTVDDTPLLSKDELVSDEALSSKMDVSQEHKDELAETSGTASPTRDYTPLNDDCNPDEGVESPGLAETSLITEKDAIFLPLDGDGCESQGSNVKPIPFFGAAAAAVRARSSSSKYSKASLNSKSSFSSKSPRRTLFEQSPSPSVDSPSRVKSVDSHDGAPLLNNVKLVTSSSGGAILNNFADFGSEASEKVDPAEQQIETQPSEEVKNSSFCEEMTNAQVAHLFPDFGTTFVDADMSGECEHGVEVEWGVDVLAPNEFGDTPHVLDTTAVDAELERTLSEAKWDNNTKVGDDISWPSETKKTFDDEVVPMKAAANDTSSMNEKKSNGNDDSSVKSDGTKSSSFHPRKLFRRRSKDRREATTEEKVEVDGEESLSDFKKFVARSKSQRDERFEDYSNRSSRKGRKDDNRSIDEESDDYTSEEYSYDGREDVVGAIANTIQKGFTGIVDIMETAFAFNNKDDDTIDYGSESSESEDEEDSYIERRMARRRQEQRRKLNEARRSSRRREYERQRMRQSSSRQGSNIRSRDNESLISGEDRSGRGQRHKNKNYARNRYSGSGRVGTRRRAVSDRYED